MKKMTKRITSILCASLMAVGVSALASCNEAVTAYEIAVENGFQGTVVEWLLSLHGADGEDGEDFDLQSLFALAQQNGYEGSWNEFLKEYLSVSISEDNDTTAITNATASVVSICAGFITTKVEKSGLYGTTKTLVPSASAGSGVIYQINKNAKTAYIITNYHVLYSKDTDTADDISQCVYVYPYGALNGFTTEYRQDSSTNGVGNGVLDNGEKMGDIYSDNDQVQGFKGIKAQFVGGAMEYDIAILKTVPNEYFNENTIAKEAEILPSESLTVGEKTFAIGNANGEGISVTSGILSVESEYITMTSPDTTRAIRYRVMRTDAAINHGNSGGGLFNANGKLIGITNAKNVEDETDNMGYALPSTQVQYVVENILDNLGQGGVMRATLGIQTQVLQSSAKIVDGKYIIEEVFKVTDYPITQTSAAYNKLSAGDVIQTIRIVDKDGAVKTEKKTLTRSYQLVDLCLTVRKGDTMYLGVKDKGEVEIKFDKDEYFVKYA